MIPKKEIIKQIDRFYNLMETKAKIIQDNIDNNGYESKVYDDAFDYFKLTSQIGVNLGYAIDNLKNKLDIMENI